MKRAWSIAVVALTFPLVACLEADGDTGEELAQQELGAEGACEKVYREDVVIEADLERVWDLLIDLPRYADWNPWIVYANGDAIPGTKVPVGVVLSGKVLDMKYDIVSVEPQVRFCTKDDAWFTLFVDGSRCRMVELQADGTVHFWQELTVKGPFTWLADLTFAKEMRAGMAAETAALKATAEAP